MKFRTWQERLARKNKRAEKGLAIFGPKRKKKAAPSEWKRLVALLDNLTSSYVRLRDKRKNNGLCAICGNKPAGVAYHFIPRTRYATRFDPDNLCAACSSCNWGEKNNRLAYRDKHIAILGKEKYEALWAKASKTAKFSTVELKQMIIDIRKKLEEACL